MCTGRLNREAKVTFLDGLVREGSALWFDKAQRAALILWRSIPEWADVMYGWARGCGFEDSVVTTEEMQVGCCWAAGWVSGRVGGRVGE
jgi:ESCRT-II complex subunit VPS25